MGFDLPKEEADEIALDRIDCLEYGVELVAPAGQEEAGLIHDPLQMNLADFGQLIRARFQLGAFSSRGSNE